MAAVLSTTPITRHVIGDLSIRFYTVSGGGTADTLATGLPSILDVLVTPTTDIAVGATWSAGTVTFNTAGAWAATVAVISRVG